MPGADLVSSLERAAHATSASIPVSSGLETTPLPAVLSSIEVVPLESAVVASVTVSEVPGLPASPQDDLDVPLSKLVPSCAEDKIDGTSSKASKLLASDNFAVDACSSSAHVGEAPPPSKRGLEKRGLSAVVSKRLPHDLLHICRGLNEHLVVEQHLLLLNVVSCCLLIDSFMICVFLSGEGVASEGSS